MRGQVRIRAGHVCATGMVGFSSNSNGNEVNIRIIRYNREVRSFQILINKRTLLAVFGTLTRAP